MSKLSRTKGSAFERTVARELFDRLGLTFSRDLRQYQRSDLGDLLCEDEAFPFLIECKHKTRPALPEWRRQAVTAATAQGKTPVVIYRITGRPIRVSAPLSAIGGPSSLWADMDLDAFAWIVREAMAETSGIGAATEAREGGE